MSEHNQTIVFIPLDIMQTMLKMNLKRDIKFAFSAWLHAPTNGETKTITRQEILRTSGMRLIPTEFYATMKACQRADVLPPNLKIQ